MHTQVRPGTSGLVVTEPYMNLPAMQDAMLQVAFEEHGFRWLYASTPAPLDGVLMPEGVRRINLGGKALTNYFKELVSYR